MKQPTKQTHMKKEDVRSQLRSLVNDVRVLSLKHPNDEVNEFKLGFINVTLKKCNEILGATLLTQHNLWFYQDLMRDIRESIEQGKFTEFKNEFIKNYTGK